MCVGELLVLLPRRVICVQCSWSYVTERSSQWPRNRGFLQKKKKKKDRIGESPRSHCPIEKVPESDLSQRVISGKFTFHSWIKPQCFMSEEMSGNCWLGRSRVALASVCRCCHIEINMRKHRTARYEEGMRPFTHPDHPSPWFGKLVLWDSARPGCRGGRCPSCLSNHYSWSWLVAACWDTYFHLLGIG